MLLEFDRSGFAVLVTQDYSTVAQDFAFTASAKALAATPRGRDPPGRSGAIKTRREVLHIGRREVNRMWATRMGPRVEMPRTAARREVAHIAARAEPVGIAERPDLIRSRDQ